MKLLYIADGRSPIAQNWISHFVRLSHEVHLVSTFSSPPLEGLASFAVIPVALSGLYGQPEGKGSPRGRLLRRLLPVAVRTRIRQVLGPFSLPRAASRFRQHVERLQPDLVHAMRIPYEGMVASMALKPSSGASLPYPLLVTVWGNDFTLHALSTPRMNRLTRQALQASDALHTDCQRDLDLAHQLGFSPHKPGIVLPAGGGVKLDLFYPLEQPADTPPNVINPRGFRAYVRNDTFFKAIPLVLAQYPGVRFVCPGMAGEAPAQQWVSEYGIQSAVDLLPPQSRHEMADLFRRSQVSVSITTHDGTPNSLIEAMACGCFPIAGDIASIREWISPGENGFLVDPSNPHALSSAILTALSRPDLRIQARERNLQLVKDRAEYTKTMRRAGEFYHRLITPS